MAPDAHASFLSRLAQDRSVFAHQYNAVSDQVLLVGLDPEAQAAASFLDERVFKPGAKGAWFGFNTVERAAATLKAPPKGYIFHVGHCGSTLVSRLVAAATESLALREPLPLRTFAMDRGEGPAGLLGFDAMARRLSLFERLWARGERSVVVKATSVCGGLVDVAAAQSRAVFLYQRPQTHLAVVLGGANAMIDLRGFAQLRYKRLARFCDLGVLSGFRVGELAALAWLTETVALNQARRTAPVFDFDVLLTQPESALFEICGALGFEPHGERVAAAVAGPIMRAYSKAPEHAYDATLRGEVIAQSERDNAVEIKAGMTWLERLAADQENVARALERFA